MFQSSTSRIRQTVAPWSRSWRALPGNWRGIVWILLSSTAFAVMAALVKALGRELHPFQIVFFRCLFGLLWLTPFFIRFGVAGLRSQRPGLHFSRALVGNLAMTTTFYAYALLPLADVVALSFATPLFMIPLAVLLLGEQSSTTRRWATLVGFGGVVVMVRPSGSAFDPWILLAVVSPFLIALVQSLIKHMTATESRFAIIGRYAIAATLLSLGPALTVWQTPTVEQLLLLLLAGLVATGAQSTMVLAYAEGEATAISPFDYSRILVAGAFGYFAFGELPDGPAVAGGLVIIASNLWLLRESARPTTVGPET
ncbi:MAG: DMT family transporter [Magnetococcales bacterium]|nr:DMT family transporter [Magnetococcales bacterium]